MRVFISHSTQDNDFTKFLRDQLRSWGYETWLDLDDIPVGARWPDEIDKGLRASDVIVGIITPDSVDSANVRNEWDWALQYNKPLYLLYLIEATLPHRYVSINYIDLTRDQSAGLNRLQKALTAPRTDFKDHHSPTPPAKISRTDKEATNRSRMLEKVRTFWIVGEVWLELEGDRAPDAVQPRVEREVQNPAYNTFTLTSGEAIGDVFNKLGRELLILGDPGSGKTMTLLELARDLIDRAEKDDILPIPVVLNLSSWAAERWPLAKWLVERLFLEYQVPRKVGQKWLANGDLLLLLDGLDEVILDHRESCIQAINTFWQAHDWVDNGIVVCSRINDYNVLNQRLHLENAIVLRPLESTQAESYIAKLGYEWRALHEALPNIPALQQLAQSPLLLNMMAVAYYRIQPGDITGFKNEDDQRQNLLKRYVARRLREEESSFTHADSRHRLAWLAVSMTENGLTVFHLEDLQPHWLRTSAQQRQYLLYIGLITGLAGGLAFGLAGGLGAGWPFGVVLGLIGGILLALSVSVRADRIYPVEAIILSNRGLVFGIVAGLTGGLTLDLAGGLALGLAVGIPVSLQAGDTVETRTKPSQGMRRSLRYGIVIGLSVGLTLGLAVGLIIGLDMGLAIGLPLGLVTGLFHDSGRAIFQHFALRLLLWRANYTPRPDRYVAFLDDAAKRQLLRKVGGGYIFRHRMLQDYFASLET